VTAKTQNTLSAFELSLLEPAPKKVGAALKRGAACPECGSGILDYNGMLELECPLCGFKSGGGGGCT
jgi:DNA-directed RNA polymerase subunit RPC12/RpoP